MLHEVLLALSGHASPLFNEKRLSNDRLQLTEEFPLLSPAETAQLQSIGRLAERHRQLRHHVAIITTTHDSIICRAVATSIQQVHLARFQQKILDVEEKILSRDPGTVGAYNIVPLASIVGEFDEWNGRMAWYSEMAQYMQPLPGPARTETKPACTGPALIDRLRSESFTGFVEIEVAAKELSCVAEIAWLRQLIPWLLYGEMPAHGQQDIFVRKSGADGGNEVHFAKDKSLLPSFVTAHTASSIIFIGKSLWQIREHSKRTRGMARTADAQAALDKLSSDHLKTLASLPLPLATSQLSHAISAVQDSLSKNVLQHLLPLSLTLQIMTCFREYFLLSRNDFAHALIVETRQRIANRDKDMGRFLQTDPVKAMRALTINESEMSQILHATWKVLARQGDPAEDESFEFARAHVVLTAVQSKVERPTSSDSGDGNMLQLASTNFADLLLTSPCTITMKIKPPLDLLISSNVMHTYSTIFSYLVAIRRARLGLSDMWRRSSARREPSRSATMPESSAALAHLELSKRQRDLRSVWATCSAAVFMVSEIAAYLDGEVLRGHCDHFQNWVRTTEPTSDQVSANLGGDIVEHNTRDPESLASGHRRFLAALGHALLLNETSYTRELRSLLGNIDVFIAYFTRLLDIQQKVALECETQGGVYAHTAGEERTIALELDRARKKVDSDLRSLLRCLRVLSQERVGFAHFWDGQTSKASEYSPYRGSGGIERLLMKLEFGRMMDGPNIYESGTT